jgi:hypothetical protein
MVCKPGVAADSITAAGSPLTAGRWRAGYSQGVCGPMASDDQLSDEAAKP